MTATIWADFHARTEDGAISLEVAGSLRSLERVVVDPGDEVALTDGEMQVRARVDLLEGHPIAWPAWETLVDLREELVRHLQALPFPANVDAATSGDMLIDSARRSVVRARFRRAPGLGRAA